MLLRNVCLTQGGIERVNILLLSLTVPAERAAATHDFDFVVMDEEDRLAAWSNRNRI